MQPSVSSCETTETEQMCDNSLQDDNSQHSLERIDVAKQRRRTPVREVRDNDISLYRTKSTHKKEQQSRTLERSQSKALEASKMLVAASSFGVQKTDSDSIQAKSNLVKSSTSFSSENKNTFDIKQKTVEDKSSAKAEQLFNFEWEEQIKDLDNAGIPVNKTVIRLLKSYKFEQVASAIALFKTRKQSHYIPNPSGYFSEALKGNWAGKSVTSDDSNVDTASVFRHWYDLARELGYCQSQEVRDKEQWVMISGSWEKWKDAVKRGYSLEYLKKIIKRNGGK